MLDVVYKYLLLVVYKYDRVIPGKTGKTRLKGFSHLIKKTTT